MTKQPSLAGNYLRGKKHPEEAVKRRKQHHRLRVALGLLDGVGAYLLVRLLDQPVELATLIGLSVFVGLVFGWGAFRG